MRLSDVERFVGLPYDADTFDCADLVVLVQRELFGRNVILPNGRPRGARGQAALGELSKPYGTRTETPVDGDLAVMLQHGRPSHAGVYFFLAHEPHVLHVRAERAFSELTPVRNLATPLEGYYAWA